MKVKLQTNISHQHGFRNPQQNVSKLNPTIYKMYTLQPSGIYSRSAKLIQHSKIS